MEPHSILIVDDDESLRRIVEFSLKKSGFKPTVTDSAERALAILRKSNFDLLISDMKMPGLSGIELMKKAHQIRPEMPVIFMTAFGSVEKAVEAMKEGAFDYITKPFDPDEFVHTVEKVLEYHRMRTENVKLKSELENQYSISNIIGTSDEIQAVLEIVRKIANTDATVLIMGESGTGKELIARAIHQTGERAGRPMVTVNCAAIPKELLESELFGHVEGAFTGAIKNKMGKFVAAHTGTIFLDEIGDMPMELQAKMLRVLEDRIVEPVGSSEKIAVDIRVLAATNQDLKAKIKKGEFREDLYFRLKVIPLNIPPLRNRPEDITLLATHFVKEFSNGAHVTISHNVMEVLIRYKWPGNVRELANIIKRMVILAKGKRLEIADIPDELLDGKQPRPVPEDSQKCYDFTLPDIEKKTIIEALERSGWNKSRAAKRLGIPRHVLIYRLKKLDIKEA
jgi:two-component system NtrC family response regulator